MPITHCAYCQAFEFNDLPKTYMKHMEMPLQDLILRERENPLWISEGNYSEIFIVLYLEIVIKTFLKNILYKGNSIRCNMDMFSSQIDPVLPWRRRTVKINMEVEKKQKVSICWMSYPQVQLGGNEFLQLFPLFKVSSIFLGYLSQISLFLNFCLHFQNASLALVL